MLAASKTPTAESDMRKDAKSVKKRCGFLQHALPDTGLNRDFIGKARLFMLVRVMSRAWSAYVLLVCMQSFECITGVRLLALCIRMFHYTVVCCLRREPAALL